MPMEVIALKKAANLLPIHRDETSPSRELRKSVSPYRSIEEYYNDVKYKIQPILERRRKVENEKPDEGMNGIKLGPIGPKINSELSMFKLPDVHDVP